MIQFLVQDMTCNHCVNHVTTAVRSVSPQASVNIDLASKAVVIHGTSGGNSEGSSERERIAAAIREAGFTPLPA